MAELSGSDRIQLGHGSGGVMTRDLLNQIIFKVFDNTYLSDRHDGAIIESNGKTAISTDSFVVSPIFFKGGNIGELAVHGTVNDIAMCGAVPEYVSLAFIVEEGMPLDEFETVVRSVKQAADTSGVQIITGDTKVVERGNADKIYINTTGFGRVLPNADISLQRVEAENHILISGPIASHGMAIMSQREGLEFESDILSDSTNLNFLVKDLIEEFGNDIRLLRDPTRGGLGSVLTEIASDRNLGVRIRETDIPVDTQVMAACEILGIDPLHVANEGNFACIVSAEVSEKVLSLMRNHTKGSRASIIGKITSENAGQVIMESSIGGQRVVTPLLGEQLPRIC